MMHHEILEHFDLAQDDDLRTKMPDGDLEGLVSQNAYLQEALETCRRDISSMNHQACTYCPVVNISSS